MIGKIYLLCIVGTKRNNRSHDLKVTTNEKSRSRSKSRSRNPTNDKDPNQKVRLLL